MPNKLRELIQRQQAQTGQPFKLSIKQEVRKGEAELKAIDKQESKPKPAYHPPAETPSVHESLAMQKLVDADFPFDESQLIAIDGVAHATHACITGAAGTGKTTCLKAIMDRILPNVGAVDIANYFGGEDQHSKMIPSIAMVSFTGRACQMIKRNFPESWHANIMTIHRMLHYVPETYSEFDDETNTLVNKMRFVPTYTADFPMPWDYIIIDEAGMLGLDLWYKIQEAAKKGCRIIMVGDINQLPPVHGSSVFGYAMIEWPSYELTHIHRQKGTNNLIVDNAWRILQGELPQTGERFNMLRVSDIPQVASKQLRGAMLQLTKADVYDPIRDTAIVATNGNPGSKAQCLGQGPLNESMAIQFNPNADRFLIDAGMERRGFAIGDKVMVTKNDHKRFLTNGMTGVIKSIEPNNLYLGDMETVGHVDDLQAKLREDKTRFDVDAMLSGIAGKKALEEKESKFNRGSASHHVTVEFEHGECTFSTFSEVCSLQLAYFITCHKSQGGEYPVVIIMCHGANKSMMYREWLYTAVTRASEKVLLLYNDQALAGALRKQKIKGSTLQEKARKFIEMSKNPLRNTPQLPRSEPC